MDKSVVIKLISETKTQDASYQFVSVETEREVFANVRSIARTEWFEAGRQGLNPDFTITMFRHDYNGELVIEYEGVRYGVYRTYNRRNDEIELYVQKKGGV